MFNEILVFVWNIGGLMMMIRQNRDNIVEEPLPVRNDLLDQLDATIVIY